MCVCVCLCWRTVQMFLAWREAVLLLGAHTQHHYHQQHMQHATCHSLTAGAIILRVLPNARNYLVASQYVTPHTQHTTHAICQSHDDNCIQLNVPTHSRIHSIIISAQTHYKAMHASVCPIAGQLNALHVRLSRSASARRQNAVI